MDPGARFAWPGRQQLTVEPTKIPVPEAVNPRKNP
jgi:hypothetical protein